MRKRPGIFTLVILTLLPCALLTLRWYSFHALDSLLWLRGTTGYSILLCDGEVQVAAASNFYHETGKTLFARHFYDGGPRSVSLDLAILALLGNQNLVLERPTHDWRVFAYGSNRYVHPHRGFSTVPAPTIVHYLQLPLWLFIALSGLLALRKWWQFWKATRNQRAFPIELVTPTAN